MSQEELAVRLHVVRQTVSKWEKGLSVPDALVLIDMAALIEMGVLHFSEASEKLFAMILVTGIIVFMGIVLPKLPFTRYTGLRLPWTVSDEDTWNVVHRILGIISIPLAVLYIACALILPNFETVTGSYGLPFLEDCRIYIKG